LITRTHGAIADVGFYPHRVSAPLCVRASKPIQHSKNGKSTLIIACLPFFGEVTFQAGELWRDGSAESGSDPSVPGGAIHFSAIKLPID
jgi:hypothetical protein